MALVINDRVKETTTSTGTGTINLAGAEEGFESFVSGVGDTNTTYYAIAGGSEFEIGIGTVTDAATDTLSRDTVISSSNSDALVNFSAGTKDVFCTLPASKFVYQDSSGKVGIGTTSPNEKLQVHYPGSGSSFLQITNTDTGSTDNKGLYAGVISGGNSYIGNRHSGDDIIFQNDNTEVMRIKTGGDVGINTSNPTERLQVEDDAIPIKIKSTGATGYTQGALLIEGHESDSTPANRGQGVYMFNHGRDRTWYMGTLYTNGTFGINYVDNASFQKSAADDANYVLRINPSDDSILTKGEVTSVVKRIYLKTTNNQSIANGATVYKTWETQTYIDTDTFTHTSGSDNITVDRAGLYHIICNLVFQNATSSARNTVRASVRVAGTEILSTRTYDYDRGSSYGEFSNNKIDTIQNLSANNIIDIKMYGENIDGSLTVEAPECELIIYRLGVSG